MKIAAWNVNSIKVRLPAVLKWLQVSQADVLLLQEIKCTFENFPFLEFESLGYKTEIVGQKAYNGVAVISKKPGSIVEKVLPYDGEGDSEARYLEVKVEDLHLASIYVPNGQAVGSEKYIYKLKFLSRLYQHIQKLLREETPFVIAGDFNIAPYAEDVYFPGLLKEERILCSLEERKALRKILHLGAIDIVRMFYPSTAPEGKQLFSWWDYREGSWQQNRGFRIDHLLLSPQAANRAIGAGIDSSPRGDPQPSDHAPIWVELT
jgi:exodeoxyribonuclease-3